MGMFGRSDGTVVTAFVAKDDMSPVVRGIRATMDKFKKDASTGFGLAAGISVFSAATKAIDFAGDSLRAFADEQASVAKLTTAIKENAQAWDGNMDSVEAVIRGRMRLGFADDAQRDSLAQLVAAIGNVDDALRVQRTAMDLARLKSISLSDAGNVLSKAYNGSTTALNKMGIKLKAGTRGMEAIDAVQQRVMGQAQAYTETLAGSAEVMALSFDEFKESVGSALTDALNPFFHLVVDLTNQAPDLDTALGRLTQQYRDMIAAKAEAIKQDESWDDEVTDLLQGVFMPQDKAIHDFTGTLGDYSRILGVTRKDLALFTEAGLTAGKSLDEIRATLDLLVRQQVDDRAQDIGYAWQTGMAQVESAVEDVPPVVKRAIQDMTQTMDEAKDPWRAAWKELAAWAKDPFSPDKFENYIEERVQAALRKARRAEQRHMPGVARRWRHIAKLMQDPVFKALINIGVGVDAALAAIATVRLAGQQLNGFIGGLFDVFGNDNDGPGGVEVGGKPRKKPKRKRAMGGPVESGATYLIGENGPELLHMGRGSGNVTPNHRMGGGTIVVNVDGRKLFEIMDGRQGRAIAMGG